MVDTLKKGMLMNKLLTPARRALLLSALLFVALSLPTAGASSDRADESFDPLPMAREVAQAFKIMGRNQVAALIPLIKIFQFHPQEGCLQRIETGIMSFYFVIVFLSGPVIA